MTATNSRLQAKAPLTDAIIIAVARLVDDAQTARRDPTHSDLEFQIARVGLASGDPVAQGQIVGKEKRVRGTLSWALEHDYHSGEILVPTLIALIQGCGGFRADSPNYVGADAISTAAAAFRAEGYELTSDGELRPALLGNLSGAQLGDALAAYVRRAKQGVADAALLAGTGKDLLEATAAHVLTERYGSYSPQANFPTLLGQAFGALSLATPQDPVQPNEPAQRRLQRSLYEAGCAVNALRNKEGTGHGRPWLPSVTDSEARTAAEIMGVIAERMLETHRERP